MKTCGNSARAHELVRGRRVGREPAEVAAGGEDLLVRRGENDHAHVVVGLGGAQRFEQLAQQLIRERVARLRVVERDRRDAGIGGDLVADLLVLGQE